MATAIKGCIILEEDEKHGRMTYERVCDNCGYHFNKVHTGLVKGIGRSLNTSYKCPKCGHNQRIEIRG